MYIKELLKEADKSMENYKFDDALVYLKSVLEIDESNYSALMTLSKIYTDFGMFEEAKEYAEKLYKKYPESKDTLFTLGFVYQSLGRLKKAISLYKKFLDIEKNYFVYLNMGMSYALLKYYRKAIENINIAIEIEPESSEAYVEKGDCLTMMGKYNEAISEYEKLLNSKFNQVEEFSLYARMGDTMAYANNIKEVIKYYNIAINFSNAEDFVFENFYEMLSGGSYESQFVPHILIHTWSLALEVHYYVLWGLAAWGLGKVAKSTARYRGMIALVSAGLFLVSFVSMFASALTTKNYSDIYFSSLTHVFPFFSGSILATLSGVGHVSSRFKMLEQKLALKQVLGIMGGSAAVLLLLSFLLKFDNLWTYLVGFLISTILASLMILAARMLHDKLPDVKEPSLINFIADTSYGVYLFHLC